MRSVLWFLRTVTMAIVERFTKFVSYTILTVVLFLISFMNVTMTK
jgi:hypothetical protein